jgi:hypothetical protein
MYNDYAISNGGRLDDSFLGDFKEITVVQNSFHSIKEILFLTAYTASGLEAVKCSCTVAVFRIKRKEVQA